jgi:hypothetical protein
MPRNSRARGVNSFRRRRALRPPYERVLIVCEGEKTEPNYFEEIRQKARLSSAHIQAIQSELGTDPSNVVLAAEKSFFDKNGAFERVYAVFDRDDHINYETAIQMASAKNGKLRNDERRPVIFEAIVSVPCFELWLLLHYANCTTFVPRGRIISQLRSYIQEYEKGMTGIFGLLQSRLSTAVSRARSLKANNQRIPGDELYTDIHELVGLLTSIKSAH